MNTTAEDLRVAAQLVNDWRSTCYAISERLKETPSAAANLADAIASMRASEREKAAKIADRFQVEGEMMPTLRAQNLTAVAIAAAIRANKE